MQLSESVYIHLLEVCSLVTLLFCSVIVIASLAAAAFRLKKAPAFEPLVVTAIAGFFYTTAITQSSPALITCALLLFSAAIAFVGADMASKELKQSLAQRKLLDAHGDHQGFIQALSILQAGYARQLTITVSLIILSAVILVAGVLLF